MTGYSDRKIFKIMSLNTPANAGVYGLLGLVLLAGCAFAPQKTATQQSRQSAQLVEQDSIAPLRPAVSDARSDLQYHVLAAEMAAERGVLKTAANEYFEAAQ